jgi:hypothetical protein
MSHQIASTAHLEFMKGGEIRPLEVCGGIQVAYRSEAQDLWGEPSKVAEADPAGSEPWVSPPEAHRKVMLWDFED